MELDVGLCFFLSLASVLQRQFASQCAFRTLVITNLPSFCLGGVLFLALYNVTKLCEGRYRITFCKNMVHSNGPTGTALCYTSIHLSIHPSESFSVV